MGTEKGYEQEMLNGQMLRYRYTKFYDLWDPSEDIPPNALYLETDDQSRTTRSLFGVASGFMAGGQNKEGKLRDPPILNYTTMDAEKTALGPGLANMQTCFHFLLLILLISVTEF